MLQPTHRSEPLSLLVLYTLLWRTIESSKYQLKLALIISLNDIYEKCKNTVSYVFAGEESIECK